ncbi:MAG: hypothetical protein ACKOWJ_04140 [Micrococcales bacterium]
MAKLSVKLAFLPLFVCSLVFASATVATADDRESSKEPTASARPTASPRPSSSAHPTPFPSTHRENDESDNQPRPTGAPSVAPHDDDDAASHHSQLNAKYGTDVDQVFLPPLVVKGTSTGPIGSVGSAGKPNQSGLSNGVPLPPGASEHGLKNATQVNPNANLPINPNANLVTNKTPADVFFQQATFGLGIMGIGAIALGSLAIMQRRRNRVDSIDTYTT